MLLLLLGPPCTWKKTALQSQSHSTWCGLCWIILSGTHLSIGWAPRALYCASHEYGGEEIVCIRYWSLLAILHCNCQLLAILQLAIIVLHCHNPCPRQQLWILVQTWFGFVHCCHKSQLSVWFAGLNWIYCQEYITDRCAWNGVNCLVACKNNGRPKLALQICNLLQHYDITQLKTVKG